MGSWWRSEDMTYVSLIVAEDAAASCIRELGILGCLQLSDLNHELTPFQKPFVSSIKRCDELERKARYIFGEIKKIGLELLPAGTVEQFVCSGLGQEPRSGAHILEEIEEKLGKYEAQLLDLNKFGNKLLEEYNGKVELFHVLQKSRQLFLNELTLIETSENLMHSRPSDGVELQTFTEAGSVAHELSFSNFAGVLPVADRVAFERMLYRSTRGNCWVRFIDIDRFDVEIVGGEIISNGTLEDENPKTVFIVFFKSEAIENKIKRICDSFNAHRYDIQDLNNQNELIKRQDANNRELKEARAILDKNRLSRKKLCQDANLSLEECFWVIRREKSTYHALNFLKSDVAGHLLRGRGWILTSEIEKARAALNRAHVQLNLPPTAILERVSESWPNPPTHFVTNKYTDAFQEFVNTYGIPRYREANPALFTAATFPFLFGIMYGDMGHGSCLTILGLILILTESVAEQRGTGEMLKGLYSARYMLFAMGLCAVYAGSIYSEFFGLGVNLFGSNFIFNSQVVGDSATMIGPYGDAATVYPFGVDPAWHISNNGLLFFNSMKMKLSVILGITQMIWGICLRGINAYYFKQWLDIVCEFIPMMIFALSFFGYMVILIFVKWSIDWDARMALGSCAFDSSGVLGGCSLATAEFCYTSGGSKCYPDTPLSAICPLGMGGSSNGCQPPNLITTLMNMALAPGWVDEPIYAGQSGVQTFLLLMAFFSVPVILIAKPYILKKRHEAAQKLIHESLGNEDPEGAGGTANPLLASVDVKADAHAADHGGDHGGGHGGDHGHGGEFNFGEIMIHQAIETIEFVLGMVSNTASYLRLWALSLAHSELAEVFWEKAILGMIESGNPAGIYVGYALFAAVTFAVLLCMDVLECFLHALRLHWVEFQNKFYKADGYRFAPFDFKTVISKAVLE